MSELSAVRAEVKTWERTFRAANGRDPTVQDIKDEPDIAEKYKLYKKLSKAAAMTDLFGNHIKRDDPPTTPPRSQPRNASSILSAKRTIDPSASLSTFNPFSPVKKKGKQKEISERTISRTESRPNPFATPRKPKPNGVEKREQSPDLFPPLPPAHPQPLVSTSHAPLRVPTSPLSRARKRLRGEPVSPSPAKDKRQRVSYQKSHLFPLSSADLLGNDDDTSDVDDSAAAGSSFVNDSPVKPSAGGKTFKLLFDEPVPQKDAQTKTKGKFSRSKTMPATAKLFERSRTSSNLFQRDSSLSQKRISEKQKNEEPNRPPDLPTASSSRSQSATGSSSDDRNAMKRPLSEMEAEPDLAPKPLRIAELPLLPPSPPPADPHHGSYSKVNARDKGKGPSRKKAKVLGGLNESSDDITEGANVKLVERTRGIEHPPSEDVDDIYFDSVLRLSVLHEHQDASTAVADTGDDTAQVQIDLPDKLLSVLAIAPSTIQDPKGERIVQQLISGKRVTHYDPSRGGEIWDVGEEEDRLPDDADNEDEWEGEPVPWEVGEL